MSNNVRGGRQRDEFVLTVLNAARPGAGLDFIYLQIFLPRFGVTPTSTCGHILTAPVPQKRREEEAICQSHQPEEPKADCSILVYADQNTAAPHLVISVFLKKSVFFPRRSR